MRPEDFNPDVRFERHLNDVLREAANPEPGLSFEARLRLAMQQQIEQQQGEIMNAASAPTSSILWGNTRVESGWNLRGLFGAALAHAFLLALMLVLVAHKVGLVLPTPVQTVALLAPPPPVPRALPRSMTMGGGGGQKGPTPVTRGTPPKFTAEQLNPPKAPPLAEPKINVPVTVDVQPDLHMAKSDVPQIGMPNSPLVGLSMGNGRGTGIGSGSGAGIGEGAGGNTGGGVRRIGGGVSAPVVLFQPEPEFSDEARKAKTAGNVLVYLQVDEHGRPSHVRVLRGIGMGLDQKAIAAVERYRFRPAMEDGHPVRVEMQVDVDFRIF